MHTIEAITANIEGQGFVALAVYVNGAYVDTIVRPIKNGDSITHEILDAILDVLMAHDIATTELRTDNEVIYKAVIRVAGVCPRLVPKRELSVLYRLFDQNSQEYNAIYELYVPTAKAQERGSKFLNHILVWLRKISTKVKRRDNV